VQPTQSQKVTQRPLALRDLPILKPGPDAQQERVRACAVCRTDLHLVEGGLQPRLLPLSPWHQIVGTVQAVRAAVRSWRVSKRGYRAGGVL